MELFDLSGIWKCEISGQSGQVVFPGTLDENHIGYPDSVEKQWHLSDAKKIGLYHDGDPIVTRLTRRYAYEGPAVYTRELIWNVPEGKRIFLECERSRQLTLEVNGKSVMPCAEPTLSTPYVFEITEHVTGRDTLTLTCDNSYPGWPYEALTKSSAAADETQTNWNGVLGFLRLRMEEPVFVEAVYVYPHRDTLDVCVTINAAQAYCGAMLIESSALAQSAHTDIRILNGISQRWMRGLTLASDVRRWDENEGNLYALTVCMQKAESKTVSFGVREFKAENGRFKLNDRTVFLRSEANCAVFPETGYPPMDVAAWRKVLSIYRSYGVNCMRFHSHCPPEAAFTAADEMGMLMQPELSNWDPKFTFDKEETRRYYRGELVQILRMLVNHPSFVMLTLGNELRAKENGHAYMTELLNLARDFDRTRLYADGSNTHFGFEGHDQASDFYTAMTYIDQDLRATSGDMLGWLNQKYPDLRTDYAQPVKRLREKTDQPVYSFEVGQYEVLPDFDEIKEYRGITDPANLRIFRDRVQACGMMENWKARVEASGELSLLCYRAEVEAAFRTKEFSGISLLGLQDFPGQGTALIGMLNAHLEPKPFSFAKPERFAAFFTDALPLVRLPRCTYTCAETLIAEVCMANYGKKTLCGTPEWTLEGGGVSMNGVLPRANAAEGGVCELGMLSIPLSGVSGAARLTLTVSLCGIKNAYSIWVYPDEQPVCPESVYECRKLDEHAEAVLAAGGCVYLAPDSTKEAMPDSIQCHFSPDFWSVGSFSAQEGSMGQMIDVQHPIFRNFPTDAHTDWQWWPMASQRAVILPRNDRAIITELDSYAYLRPMAQLIEWKCGKGRLLLSSLGLHNLMQHPEARALQASIYRYLASEEVCANQEISLDEVRRMVC